MSVVLLVLATFMYRGFQEQLSSGPGYRTDHLLMMSFDPSLVHYSDEDTRRFFLRLAEQARAVPGVKSVALASSVPMATDGINAANVIPEGHQLPVGRDSLSLFSAPSTRTTSARLGFRSCAGAAFAKRTRRMPLAWRS